MRRFFSVCMVLLFALLSCTKQSEKGLQRVDINTEVAKGTAFRFDLKEYIKEKEFPVITRPPLQYRVSRILYNGVVSGPVYELITDAEAGSSDHAIIKIVKEHEHNPLQTEHDELDHAENDDYTSVIITINYVVK
ncbi:MAG TPA: hypothetical protein VF610_08840 [Segetibacter sp.]